MVTPRAAIMASANREPPVRPTLTPRVPKMLSIFWDTFKKATAQKNQISTFPVTASLLDAATWASTSASVRAKAGAQSNAASTRAIGRRDRIRFFMVRLHSK